MPCIVNAHFDSGQYNLFPSAHDWRRHSETLREGNGRVFNKYFSESRMGLCAQNQSCAVRISAYVILYCDISLLSCVIASGERPPYVNKKTRRLNLVSFRSPVEGTSIFKFLRVCDQYVPCDQLQRRTSKRHSQNIFVGYAVPPNKSPVWKLKTEISTQAPQVHLT